MRSLFVSLFLLFCLPGLTSAAQLNLTANSTVSISGLETFCQGETPYARINLLINGVDKGLPGLIYAGSHDAGQTIAEFYYDSHWERWNGGMFPPNIVMRNGLNDVTLIIPLDRVAEKIGWRLYVGYGVLTAESERKVQQMIQSYQIAKTKLPGRQLPTIDPDHYRRTLVQQNMTDNVKYRYVIEWSNNLVNMCVAY